MMCQHHGPRLVDVRRSAVPGPTCALGRSGEDFDEGLFEGSGARVPVVSIG